MDWFDPLDAYLRLRSQNSVLLYSASQQARWSYVCAEPILEFKARKEKVSINGKIQKHKDPLGLLEHLFEKYAHGKNRGQQGPPFQGGIIGYLSYEALHYMEDVLPPLKDDVSAPWLHFLFFDHGIAFDHFRKKVHAFGPKEKVEKLKVRIEENKKIVSKTGNAGKIILNFTKDEYFEAVELIREKIKAGETYQANLSQRFECQTTKDPLEIFSFLNEINPSPYSAFFQTTDLTIVSNSPELLFELRGKKIITRPIKGTCPRGRNRADDQRLQRELQSSEKENAELTMIVDLARNDVGKICRSGSVKPKLPFEVEKYSHVQHLIGPVEGVLRPECGAFDALRALFPGGSITGCPKVRTMQILREVEPCARGPYTGSLGWVGWNGDACFNILIRTIYFKGASKFAIGGRRRSPSLKAYFHSGGGIVYDSVPEKEWEETLHKAQAIRETLVA